MRSVRVSLYMAVMSITSKKFLASEGEAPVISQKFKISCSLIIDLFKFEKEKGYHYLYAFNCCGFCM